MEFHYPLEIAKLILSLDGKEGSNSAGASGVEKMFGFCGPETQISDTQRQGRQGTASEEVGSDVRLRLSQTCTRGWNTSALCSFVNHATTPATARTTLNAPCLPTTVRTTPVRSQSPLHSAPIYGGASLLTSMS